MKLYFIRHGEKETTADINPVIGHTDPPLTKIGFEQAISLVEYFKDVKVDFVYASEYLRVQQTAEPLSKAKSIPVKVDRRLNEIDNGLIETMTEEDIRKSYPAFWNDFFEHKHDCRFPGGETGEEVKERQNAFLEEIRKIDGTYLLFCHDGFIRILMCNLLGMPVYHRYRFKCDYCGITEVLLENGEWKINRFNNVNR
jgi:broad specificity phosphatase PhoE